MKVWKDALYAGVVHLPSRTVNIRPRDVANAADQGNRMLACGRAVPAIFEHDADTVSLSAWERRRRPPGANTAGWVERYRVGPAGELQVLLDIDDDLAAEARRARYVSPRLLWNFRDETGRVWPGYTAQHVAITNLPIQLRQKPFDLSRAGDLFLGRLCRGGRCGCSRCLDLSAQRQGSPTPTESEEQRRRRLRRMALLSAFEGSPSWARPRRRS